MNSKNLIYLLLFLPFSFCCKQNQQNQNVLNLEDVYIVDSLRTNKIFFHRSMSSLDSSYYPQIIKSIKSGIDTTNKLVEFTDVKFRVIISPERTIPSLGMSGVADNKHIYIFLNPTHTKFDEAITTHIIQTIPHEYHHTLRDRTVGYGSNLFESMVSEGLANHFAMEVCKMDTPIWCKALSEKQYKEWKGKAEKVWFDKEFDHFEWFVGLKKTIPSYTGHTIGFRMIGDYLKEYPDETAASLYKTSADKFLEKNKSN